MVEVINKYETIFILNPAFDEEKTNEVVEKFKSLISQHGEVTNEELDRIYRITDGILRSIIVKKED